MKRAITTHATDFAAILVLLILSGVVAGYILHMERLRFPFIESSPTKLYAELPTGQAFTPGQGQSVRVSGVQIGQIGGVQLGNGRARIEMDIDQKYTHLIHTDATALARPRTGLQDLFLEVNPGTLHAPLAKPGWTIPVSNTLPEVNIDEILASLDADTRAYLGLLINGAGAGLKVNGGGELAALLKRFLPTHRDLARLNGAVAVRGTNLRRLINSLQRLNTSLVTKKSQIVSLVDASATVFRAFASQNANVSRAIADLPATLRQTSATLAKVQTFAQVLGPTATSLLPAARALPAANAAISALARPSAPIIQNQIRPFVVAARPLVRNLTPASINLAKATPDLSRTFGVLNHLFNLLGFNPGDSATGGQHGYLWWLAWLDHNSRTLFSVQDATGVFRPLFIQVSCTQFASTFGSTFAIVGAILNLAPVKTLCKAAGLSKDVPSKALAGASPRPTGPGASTGASSSSTATGTSTGTSGSTAAATSSSTSTASAGLSTIAASPPSGKSVLSGVR